MAIPMTATVTTTTAVQRRAIFLWCPICNQIKPTTEFQPLEGADEDLRDLFSDSCSLCLVRAKTKEAPPQAPPVLGPFQLRAIETAQARASRRYVLKQRCLAQWRSAREQGVRLAKACSVCTEVKGVEEFDVDLSQPDCLTELCSLCLREQEAKETEWQAAKAAFERGDLDPESKSESIVDKVDRELAKVLAAEDKAWGRPEASTNQQTERS